MNTNIYEKIKDNEDLLKLFSMEEVTQIFQVLDSDLSESKKKETLETIIKDVSDENI